jgi:hypothetical protein
MSLMPPSNSQLREQVQPGCSRRLFDRDRARHANPANIAVEAAVVVKDSGLAEGVRKALSKPLITGVKIIVFGGDGMFGSLVIHPDDSRADGNS